MLKASGQIQEANKQMQEFISMAPNDDRAKVSLNQIPITSPKKKEQAKMYDIKYQRLVVITDFELF
jgi:hypothetical protein